MEPEADSLRASERLRSDLLDLQESPVAGEFERSRFLLGAQAVSDIDSGITVSRIQGPSFGHQHS